MKGASTELSTKVKNKPSIIKYIITGINHHLLLSIKNFNKSDIIFVFFN